MTSQESDGLRGLIDDAFASVTGWGVIDACLILLASWQVVRSCGSGVHQHPPPYTLPTGFADGTHLLELRRWHDPDITAAERCMGSVIAVVKRTLDDEGIPIPPPAAIFLGEPPENRHLEQRDPS